MASAGFHLPLGYVHKNAVIAAVGDNDEHCSEAASACALVIVR